MSDNILTISEKSEFHNNKNETHVCTSISFGGAVNFEKSVKMDNFLVSRHEKSVIMT